MGDFRTLSELTEPSSERGVGRVEASLVTWGPLRAPGRVRPGTARWLDDTVGRDHLLLQPQHSVDTAPRDGRAPLGPRLRIRLRRVLLLIDQYFWFVQIESERYRLDSLVRDLIVDARDCFTNAAMLRTGNPDMSPDHERCVAELEGFLEELRCDRPPSHTGVMHAVDGLVVECVLLGLGDGDDAAAGGALPSDGIG
jgi:hypothetical protein